MERLKLSVLPNELLDAICIRLSRQSCYALALACKSTNASATAALYHTYANRSHPSKSPFYLFLRTICESREHAAMVKCVDIRGWRSEHEVATGAAWRPAVLSPLMKEEAPFRKGPHFTSIERSHNDVGKKFLSTAKGDFHLFLNTAVRMGLVEGTSAISVIPALKKSAQLGTTLKTDADLIRHLKYGVEDAHFILLIAQLPNLEKLSTDGLSPYPLLDWHHFLSRSKAALGCLYMLDLCGSSYDEDGRVVKTTLQILDILPGLEALRLFNISAQGHRHTGADMLPSKKLRSVSLSQSAVRHRLIGKIANTQQIRYFQYTSDHPPMHVNPGAAFTGTQITDHLKSSHSSLRTLKLSPMIDYQSFGTHKYTSLEVLDITVPALLPCYRKDQDVEDIKDALREHLPKSLKVLALSALLAVQPVFVVTRALAGLKTDGDIPCLERLVLGFLLPGAMALSGFSPMSLPEIRSAIEGQLGSVPIEAGIQLDFTQAL